MLRLARVVDTCECILLASQRLSDDLVGSEVAIDAARLEKPQRALAASWRKLAQVRFCRSQIAMHFLKHHTIADP